MALTGATVHDSKVLAEELIDSIGPVRGKRDRPRKSPGKLHSDKGYDFPRCRRFLRGRGIRSRIARRSVETSEKLGRHRWVVERTLAWLARYRRLYKGGSETTSKPASFSGRGKCGRRGNPARLR